MSVAATPEGANARARSSFSIAFRVLPAAQREALDALYAFCRAVDDAVDDATAPEDARRALAGHRRLVASLYSPSLAAVSAVSGVSVEAEAGATSAATAMGASPALRERLRSAVRAFPIARADLDAIIEGCSWDVDRTRYATWGELREYCLRVASAVGLAAIEIFGHEGERARDYAIDLGLALQLTNILRDVDEDFARGRVYLPAEDLRAFGVLEADLVARTASGRRPPEVERLLRFEAARAELHFARARAALDPRDRPRFVAAEMMGAVYRALLDRLLLERFPHERLSLAPLRKATAALAAFASVRARSLIA